MKKIKLLTALLLITNLSYSQWITRNIDNGFDDPYRITYTEDIRNSVLLKLEKTNEGVAIYLTGRYYCSENPVVDVVFKVRGQNKRHSILGKKSKDSRSVFLILDITTEDQKDFLNDFLNASIALVRVNEEHCTDSYYSFNMTNSTNAFNFMNK
jgi:hypothetical protein